MAITGLLMTPGVGRGRELYGLERSPDNSLMVVCGDEVVVVAACNVVAADDVVAIVDVAATNGVVVAVGAADAVVVWVQWCWMRACTNPQSRLVSLVVTLRGKEPSWWYRQTT